MSSEPSLPLERSHHRVLPVGATDAEFVPPFSEGQLLLNKYRVKGLIGTGGIGFVMSAVNVGLDEPVALKFLRPEFLTSEEAVHRFMTEARLASKIHSPHVTRVLDICELPEGGPFIVMDLLVGCDLQQVLYNQGPLPASVAVHYTLQACEALASAHARNILHRDVKPDNLFLARQQHGPDIIKILDFGISKLQMNRLEDDEKASPFQTKSALGSPSYMSPEQIRADSAIDSRTDVWSLGCVLYELLAGQHAFDAPTLMQVCAAVLERPPPAIHVHVDGVPGGLESVILRCLEKEPALRYGDVAELAKALAPFAPASALGAVERCCQILGDFTTPVADTGDDATFALLRLAAPTRVEDEPVSTNAPPSAAPCSAAPLSMAPVALNAAEPSVRTAFLPTLARNWLSFVAIAVALIAFLRPSIRNQTPVAIETVKAQPNTAERAALAAPESPESVPAAQCVPCPETPAAAKTADISSSSAPTRHAAGKLRKVATSAARFPIAPEPSPSAARDNQPTLSGVPDLAPDSASVGDTP